ncbi:hypothetical protein HK405_004848, partial [Cladochytrium tenue]
HKRFAEGAEVIDFITEGLVCHAIIQRDHKYVSQTSPDPYGAVMCELVAKTTMSGTLYNGIMQRNSASAEYVLFEGTRTRLSAEVIRKRDALKVALQLFGKQDKAIIKTYSQHKSSNLYRLLAFVQRYLYFLRDEGHVRLDAA